MAPLCSAATNPTLSSKARRMCFASKSNKNNRLDRRQRRSLRPGHHPVDGLRSGARHYVDRALRLRPWRLDQRSALAYWTREHSCAHGRRGVSHRVLRQEESQSCDRDDGAHSKKNLRRPPSSSAQKGPKGGPAAPDWDGSLILSLDIRG
ncbi:MAG: hypothetical protein ACI8X5_000630 [Planctomycetota bacterium]|jgi:hypothetical protein